METRLADAFHALFETQTTVASRFTRSTRGAPPSVLPDPQTGRPVVVVGTYARVEPSPVGLFEAMVAIPRGMANASDVVFMILFGTAAFTVVDRTGALATGVAWLVGRLGHRRLLIIPAVSLFFAAGGVVENMQEEVIALIPVLTLLARRLGFTPIVAVAMSLGSAFVGASFSPINPFQVVIAQQVADVPRLSGWAFRTVFLALAVTLFAAMIAPSAAHAIDAISDDASASASSQAQEIDDNDDTRVEVQLVVLAVAGGTVFVLGTGVYLLRRKLGLVPPPPEPGGDAHH